MREWTRNTKKLVGKAKGHAFAGDNTGVVRHYVALFCVLQPIWARIRSRGLESRWLHLLSLDSFAGCVQWKEKRSETPRSGAYSDLILQYERYCLCNPSLIILFFSSEIFIVSMVYVLNPWIDRQRQGFPMKPFPTPFPVAFLLDSSVHSGSLFAFALTVLCLNALFPAAWIPCRPQRVESERVSSGKTSLATLTWKEPCFPRIFFNIT